jgi:hypothetical protein
MMDEKIINKKLKRLYGYQDGGANFRLARTNDQIELRLDELTKKFIFKPRYNYLPERGYWVLEKLWRVVGEASNYLGGDWTYEPIYIYINPDTKEPLPVTDDSIHAFIHLALYGEKRKDKENWREAEEAEYERQSTVILEYLQNEVPSMAIQLKHGSAVVVPELKEYGPSDNRIVSPDGNQGEQAGDGQSHGVDSQSA